MARRRGSAAGWWPRAISPSRLVACVAGAALAAVLVAACVPAHAVPTPIVVVVTFAPTPTPAPIAAATDTPSPTPLPPTPEITLAPTPVVVGSPDGPSASASSEEPGSSATASTAPVSTAAPASVCSGSAGNKSFWSEVAKNMTWAVYCPVVPAGWTIKGGTFDGSSPGSVLVTLAGPGRGTLQVQEGAFCRTGAASCSPKLAEIGPSSFGDQLGMLDSVPGGYGLYVNPGTSLAYTLTGTGLTQDEFEAIAAAMVRVAR